MPLSRRALLQLIGSLTISASLAPLRGNAMTHRPVLKPRHLAPGDTVGLINPAGATFETVDIAVVQETLKALGLQSKTGDHVLDRYGYLAGKDEDRAADIQQMFEDDGIQALLAVRGGWGCNRILPLLNYVRLARHPKILLGYSDITSLLVALYARAGLVTFHGPVGTSTWNPFTVGYFKSLLFNGEAVTMQNPAMPGAGLVQTENRVETIHGGTARGVLVGGNLTVLTAMLGSPYVPSWEEAILFVEDDGEQIYRIDRMLTQLRIAGVLEQLAGFIFGKCTKCTPGEGYGSLTLEDVLRDQIGPLRIPAWYGAMIGHIEDKFTVPVGVEAEIDADKGTIRLLESAVT